MDYKRNIKPALVGIILILAIAITFFFISFPRGLISFYSILFVSILPGAIFYLFMKQYEDNYVAARQKSIVFFTALFISLHLPYLYLGTKTFFLPVTQHNTTFKEELELRNYMISYNFPEGLHIALSQYYFFRYNKQNVSDEALELNAKLIEEGIICKRDGIYTSYYLKDLYDQPGWPIYCK